MGAQTKPRQKPSFFESILNLRLMAVAVYDRARVKKLPSEQLATHLKPIIDQLHLTIKQRAGSNIVDCIEAMAMFEGLAKAHHQEAERYLQKAEDDMEYVGYIKEELAERMKAEKVTQLRHEDHMVILNVVDGKDYVTYR